MQSKMYRRRNEPARSIIAASHEAPTAAPSGLRPPGYPARLEHVLDVLNAPGTTTEIFQALLRPTRGILERDLDLGLAQELTLQNVFDDWDQHMLKLKGLLQL